MKKLLIIGLLSITSLVNAEAIVQKNKYVKEYQKINDNMHSEMNIGYTGDPDIDFVLSMIPHHKGALEMAKLQLKYGLSPQLKKLAEEIIIAQEKEISYMEEYLKSKGVNSYLNDSTHEGHH